MPEQALEEAMRNSAQNHPQTGLQTGSARLPLEDAYSDILNKARKGLGLTLEELEERSQTPQALLKQLFDGDAELDQETQNALKKAAFALNLQPERLLTLAQGRWYPDPIAPIDGFAMFTTDYGDMTVNAYLLWDPKTKIAATFDTGATAKPILDFVKSKALTVCRVFITHTHMDHLADLDALCAAYPDALAFGSAIENPLGLKPLSDGHGLSLGDLEIRVLGTHGHTPGGLSYYVTGLSKPLAISGDALFTGSMGGAAYAYQEALENNRKHLLSLPKETVLCPGHGPLSTIGEQRHNPFFPQYQA